MVNKMIIANVLHRPVRTIVSVLAVAIEVAMVLLVVALTTGMLSETAKRVEGVGADIMVQPPNSSFLLGVTTAPMPIKIGDRIKELDHVQYVAPVLLWFDTDVSAGLNVVYGIDMQSFDNVSGGFVYYSGGPLAHPYDILVDDWYARSHHLKVGDIVKLLNHNFTVVGVVEHGKGSRLFIPITTAQQMLGAVDRASIFFVKCTSPGYTQATLSEIDKLLPGYKILSIREYMSMMTSNNIPELGAFVNVMIAIAVAIGFLVIFLSMYTTITERTREIGILKSLGASKVYIVELILKESALLAVAGIICGLIAVVVIRKFIGVSMPTVPLEAMHVGWVGRAAALAIGGAVIGAFYPALRASRLDPVEALGYE